MKSDAGLKYVHLCVALICFRGMSSSFYFCGAFLFAGSETYHQSSMAKKQGNFNVKRNSYVSENMVNLKQNVMDTS